MEFITMKMIEEVIATIRERSSAQPRVGMILGSGLGALANSIEVSDEIPTADLPHWPVSTVEGHAGRLIFGVLEGQNIMVLQGRTHYYEGYSTNQIGLPIRVMKSLGAEFLFVSNAAGAINADFNPGDLMCITDHVNLIGMAGLSPLRGPNLDEYGPRFPDMARAYDWDLIALARQAAQEENILLHEGVYFCLSGPEFETQADLKFVQLAGADAVGMSTVAEVTVARHSGMRVLGLSGITNKTNLDGKTFVSHEKTLAAGETIAPKLAALIAGVLRRI